MKNFWEKFKELVSRGWNGLTKIGKILLGLIIIGIIVLASFLLAKDTDEDKQAESGPEIAQTYEPSIGTPLPADTPGITGDVGGASTTKPSEQPATNFVAPHSGIDPTEPVAYRSDELNFAATLPAGTNVTEESSRIAFFSKSKTLQYIVSVNKSTENITDIEAQLRNSPTVSNISYTTFNNFKAIKFTVKELGSGLVFTVKGQVYYLLGDSNYFSTFKLL